MKTQKSMPLLSILLAVSMLCASLLAAGSAWGIYRNDYTEEWQQPVITVLMQGIKHRNFPWFPANTTTGGSQKFSTITKETKNSADSLTGSPTAKKPAKSPDSAPAAQKPTKSSTGTPAAESSCTIPNTTLNEGDSNTGNATDNTEPESLTFEDVEPDYFDDALFIGDSRVVGVQLYSGWDNITYYAESGMTIYDMFDCQVPDEKGEKISIEEALKQNSFGKIYLEIGINEMGTGTTDSFMEAYEAAIEHLQELQPDALLFLCGIMYVEQDKSETDSIFNNPNIQERNERIAELADGQNIFYLDINETVADSTGNLNPDYTWDAVHLLGKYDVLWIEYFSHHGIIKEKSEKHYGR